mgnify:FL=1
MSGFKKAIKKVTKTVVKGATFGQGEKIVNVLSGGLVGKGPLEGPLNMNAGQAAMQKQAEAAARLEQTRFDSQATALKNQTLLEGANAAQNTVQVQTGGGDTPDSVLNDMRRRKRPSASVATGLGIY